MAVADHMAALRAYVLAGERQVNDGTILLDFRHSNLQRNLVEIAFHAEHTLLDVKERLHRMTGSAPGAMQLSFQGRALVGDDTRLGGLGLPQRALIHVLDTDPNSISRDGGLDDDSKVEKYEISEEAYDARPNTVRAWMRQKQEQEQRWKLTQQHLLEQERLKQSGQAGENVQSADSVGNDENGENGANGESAQAAASASSVAVAAADSQDSGEQKQETLEEVRQRIKVGDRCEVSPGARRGEVVYVGPVPELPGNQPVWVGVRFDWPVGRGDGCAGGLLGRRYFQALPNHGGFLKPQAVKVGDYPSTLTLSSSDDDDSDNDDDKEPLDAGNQRAAAGASAGSGGAAAAKAEEEELFEDL